MSKMYKYVFAFATSAHSSDITELPRHLHQRVEDRMKTIGTMIRKLGRPFKFLQPVKCKGKQHLQDMYDHAMKNGRSGVLITKPDTFYYDFESVWSWQVSELYY